MATFRRIHVSRTCAGAIIEFVVALSHRCLLVIPQPSNMSQWSGTDSSSHFRTSTSEAQMFSSSWLRESVTCPVKEAASSMLANTCLCSCSASGSDSLHAHNFRKQKRKKKHLERSCLNPRLKLSGSHMALVRNGAAGCFYNLMLLSTKRWKQYQTLQTSMVWIEHSDCTLYSRSCNLAYLFSKCHGVK